MIKNKNRSIPFFISTLIIFLIWLYPFDYINNVKATSGTEENIKNVDTIEIKVDYSGIRSAETKNDIDEKDNLLTRVSDVLLSGQSLYTNDSITPNELHGDEPGRMLVGEMGYIPVDSNGEFVESLNITLQSYSNVSKTEVAIAIYAENPVLQSVMTEEEAIAYFEGLDDVSAARYGTYTVEYQSEIRFNEKGQFILVIPENVSEDYFLSIVEIENPETGEMIGIDEIARLFIARGDTSQNPENDDNNEDEKDENDDAHRYHSLESSTTNYVDITPSISASIYSDKYNVQQGIPTSENITYQLTADNALYDITTRATTVKTGVKDITIKLIATYNQKYTKVEINESGEQITKTWTERKTLTRTVTQNYSYELPQTILYDVPASNIYPVQMGALIANNNENLLKSGTLSLVGSGIVPSQKLNVKVKNPNVNDIETLNIGHYSSKSAAQSALNNNDGSKVKNRIISAVYAAVSYTGNVNYAYYGLNVTTKSHNGVKPVVAKTTGSTTDRIPSTYPNGLYVGNGTVMYAGSQTFDATPNNVIVHTPVVNNSYIYSTSNFINQKINIDKNRTYLMLDEQFTIRIPNNGTHNDIKGYGTRTYNSGQGVVGLNTTWGKIKDVKLPFDAYLHYTKNATTYKYFIKANTWLSESGAGNIISLMNNSYTFTIPVWVTEHTYDIQTRVIAENAIDSSMYELTEKGKNSLVTNYVAINSIPVEVIGKIYDLRVSASNDPGWSSIYSKVNETNYIDATEFPFGTAGQNANTAYKYAPKLGYTFVFDFKTKGTKSNNIDVSVQPEGFYFVSRDGKTTQEVDLYYNTTNQSNVKITASDTNVSLAVRLRDTFMKVASQEFIDSTRIYESKYNYSISVKIGTLAKLNLPHALRLCYNNFEEYVNSLYGKGTTINSISSNAGNKDTVIGSVGHWYAGYRLPASTKAVPAGMDINTAIKNNSILKDGYIVVKFDIKTKYENKSGNYDYLRYMGPEALNDAGENLGRLNPDWTKAGMQTITLPNGNNAQVPVGSVAIYDASLRSSNDAEIGGTH